MAEGYARPEGLVDTAWVAEHLNDPKVRLVEVDVDTTAYEQGHIPGAVGWNWQKELQQQVARDVLTPEQVAELCAAAGIGNDTTIVFYGDNNNWFAAWAFWNFVYHGNANVKLMNGGRRKWLEESRELTTDAPSYERAGYTPTAVNADLRASRDFILQRLGSGVTLVDVRAPAEFRGELLAPANLPQEGAQRGGHIPSAINIPWGEAVKEDGTFKSAEDLAALYGGRGVRPGGDLVAYCRIGERSSHTWFVLTYLLGYPNVRNYDGSWTEWGSLVGAPIER
ncbi:MAG: sulfurtransferase [Chloroflexi bacterium]|nr:sulfurtransferase [Chloroflexota bacterium]